MIGKAEKIINWLLKQKRDLIFEIKIYKEKRNGEQNKKYWKLLYKLAYKLNLGIEELHFNMLKDYSVRYEFLSPYKEIRGVEYYEKKSKIVKDGKEFYVYHVFTPSHELNETEFSRLLSGLVDECKEQGIDTRSPNEILRDECL